jgi:phospholipid/cholesterol/gamma-HCH transport system substrate-binding protein
MKIPHSAIPLTRTAIVLAFIAMCAGLFGFLWINSGGNVPGLSDRGYRVSLSFPTASNLVYDGDVTMAGVKVGSVRELDVLGDRALVTMQLDSNAPLHQGASVQVRNKTLIEETYLEISDGSGPAIPNGGSLPESAAKEAVELNDILKGLDPPTRQSLGTLLRSLGAGTQDTRQGVSETIQGLGDIGRQGHDAVMALRDQSADLERLTQHSARMFAALDTRQGQIAQLVRDADRLTRATSNRNEDIKAVMRQLPGVLDAARSGSTALSRLSPALAPVAQDLRSASPDLNAALGDLPQTSADLRGLLPPLDGVFNKAPATLERTDDLRADAHDFFPAVNNALSDANPALAFLVPYSRDLAAFFTNIGQATNGGNADGNWLRLMMVFNEQSVAGTPVSTDVGPLRKNNPYPYPGQSYEPGPFNGTYPRIERDPPR